MSEPIKHTVSVKPAPMYATDLTWATMWLVQGLTTEVIVQGTVRVTLGRDNALICEKVGP